MRKCIIVGNPGIEGEDTYCDGVNRDVENYYVFLRSPLGGAWRSREIISLDRPSLGKLMQALVTVNPEDYLLFIFSGHGRYSLNSDSSILELRAGVEFNSLSLNQFGCAKLIILDCCREVSEEIERRRLFAEALRNPLEPVLDPLECRKYYDKIIESCGDTTIIMNSCSIGQRSRDNEQTGGWFSSNLLRAIKEYHQISTTNTTREYEWITAPRAFEKAKLRVKLRSNFKQIPVIDKPRSEPYLPIGIIA
jgi:hypothetical protein